MIVLVVIVMVVSIIIIIIVIITANHNFSLLLRIVVRHVDVEDNFVLLILHLCEDAARTNEANELRDVRTASDRPNDLADFDRGFSFLDPLFSHPSQSNHPGKQPELKTLP